jgi:hypothetical protein
VRRIDESTSGVSVHLIQHDDGWFVGTVEIEVEVYSDADDDAVWFARQQAVRLLRPRGKPGRAKGTPNVRIARRCDQCGETFEAGRSGARFCSTRCRVAAHRAGNVAPSPVPSISPDVIDGDRHLRGA